MECHPWFEVSDRRKIRFRNVQIKALLVFEQGRPLQVSTSFDNFDQFGPVSTSFDQFRPVLTSLDWFISLLITSKIQYFRGGSLLLPTSVLCAPIFLTYFWQSRWWVTSLIFKHIYSMSYHLGHFVEFHFLIASDNLHIIVDIIVDIFLEFSALSKGSLYTNFSVYVLKMSLNTWDTFYYQDQEK